MCLASHNHPAPVINEDNKYIMHTSVGAKLFIGGKLDYCLKVDEPSTNAKKKRICVHICSKFCEASHKKTL